MGSAVAKGTPFPVAIKAAHSGLRAVFVDLINNPLKKMRFRAESVEHRTPLPVGVDNAFAAALKTARPAVMVAREFSDRLDASVTLADAPAPLTSITFRTHRLAGRCGSLRELALRSGRKDTERTRAFWTTFDLLVHRGLVVVGDHRGPTEALEAGLVPYQQQRLPPPPVEVFEDPEDEGLFAMPDEED